MADQGRDIASIERLLNRIREENGVDSIQTTPRKWKKPLVSRQSATLGVLFENSHLSLALVTKTRNTGFGLMDFSTVHLPKEIRENKALLPDFLGKSIRTFLGKRKAARIWTALPEGSSDARYLTIPDVAEDKLENAVYWTYKNEAGVIEQDEVFDFEVLGNVRVKESEKKGVMAFKVSGREIVRIRELFRNSGFPLTGITAPHFALQNLLRSGLVDGVTKGTCILSIGPDSSRIAVFSGQDLQLTRLLKTGLSSFGEALVDRKKGIDPEKAIELFKASISGQPDFQDMPWSAEEFGKMVDPVMERLLGRTERTLDYYYNTISGEKVKTLFLEGVLSEWGMLRQMLPGATGLRLIPLDTARMRNIRFDETLALPGRRRYRQELIQTIGISVSDPDITPNFLFTRKNKREKQRQKNRTLAAIAVFAALAVFLGAALFWQDRILAGQEREIRIQKQKLAGYGNQLSRADLTAMSGRITQTGEKYQKYQDRYFGVALLAELSTVTPHRVSLVNLRANPYSQKEKIVIKGVVSTDETSQEPVLAGFLFRLEKSPFFNGIRVMDKERTDTGLEFKLGIGAEEQPGRKP